jgi:hypothetical protein
MIFFLFFSFSTLSSPFSCVISWKEVSCNINSYSLRDSIFNPLTSPSSSPCSLLLLEYDILKCIFYIYPAWCSFGFLILDLVSANILVTLSHYCFKHFFVFFPSFTSYDLRCKILLLYYFYTGSLLMSW